MVKLWDSKEIHNGKRIAQILPAKKWYGKWSTGAVVLVGGQPSFHGTTKEAKDFYKGIK